MKQIIKINNMGLMKVFSGSEILIGFKRKIEAINVDVPTMKDNIQSARLRVLKSQFCC
jgi:hypothetical protein